MRLVFALILLAVTAPVNAQRVLTLPVDRVVYAICAFTADHQPSHRLYEEHRGTAWVAIAMFEEGATAFPPMEELGQELADHIRSGGISAWNPNYKNEKVHCRLNDNPEMGQASRNQDEWVKDLRSAGWHIHVEGSGVLNSIYRSDGEAWTIRSSIFNRDWHGPTQYIQSEEDAKRMGISSPQPVL